MAPTHDREKALDLALAQIDKNFGKGSVMRLGQEARQPLEVIPTGSIALDIALGIGGLPRGRVVEIYGPESSGKTTVALHAVANAQAKGGIAASVDGRPVLVELSALVTARDVGGPVQRRVGVVPEEQVDLIVGCKCQLGSAADVVQSDRRHDRDADGHEDDQAPYGDRTGRPAVRSAAASAEQRQREGK